MHIVGVGSNNGYSIHIPNQNRGENDAFIACRVEQSQINAVHPNRFGCKIDPHQIGNVLPLSNFKRVKFGISDIIEYRVYQRFRIHSRNIKGHLVFEEIVSIGTAGIGKPHIGLANGYVGFGSLRIRKRTFV